MYNDEQNLYHYTYRKDGTEPGQRYDAKQPTVDEQLGSYRQQQEQQTQNSQPVYQSQPQGGQTPHKNGKNRLGLKIASLALVCALLGGLVGGGTAYLVSNSSSSNTTEVNVSNRKPTEIQLKTVDGKNPMTDAELYAANVNSVVSINITATSDPNFFGQTTQTAGAGSGFILTPDGYIVTNYHVVGDADTVKVTLYNGDSYDAQYIGGDEDYDIAVIKIEATDLPNVTLGNSDSLNVGDHVLAIGNPLGRGRHPLQHDPGHRRHQPRQLRRPAVQRVRRSGGYRVRQVFQLRQPERGGSGLCHPHQRCGGDDPGYHDQRLCQQQGISWHHPWHHE